MSCLETAKVLFFPSDIPESELPDHFSSFFDQKIASICTELDSQPVVDTNISHSFVGSELCSFEPVWQEFACKLICDSAPSICVLDPFPTTLLKKNLDDLVPLICRIVNDSLLSGSVPRQFKEAVVIPLLKKTGLDASSLKKTIGLCQICHFFPRCWRRLCCISFAAICWPTISLRPSSLRTVHITARKQPFWTLRTAFLVVLMKAGLSF